MTVIDYEEAVRCHERVIAGSNSIRRMMEADIKNELEDLHKKGALGTAQSFLENKGMLSHLTRSMALARWAPNFTSNDTDDGKREISINTHPRTAAPLAKRIAEQVTEVARQAQTVYVSKGTMEAAADAADDLEEMPVREHLLFDPGMYVFSEPLRVVDHKHAEDRQRVLLGDEAMAKKDLEETYAIVSHGMLVFSDSMLGNEPPLPWSTGQRDDRWWVILLADLDRVMDYIDPLEESALHAARQVYGNILIESLGTFTAGDLIHPGYKGEFRFAAAVLRRTVAEAQRIATVSTTKPTKRTMRRAGMPSPGDINVIYLPREARELEERNGMETGSTTRRHIVRGHWRRQPYGPREADPRPWRWTYIDAHERGSGELVEVTNVYRA